MLRTAVERMSTQGFADNGRIQNNTRMKLAEGLLLRADLIKKIEHLQNRIRPVLIVSDDKVPQEDPEELLAQMRKAIRDLETLIVRINKTNNKTLVEGEGSLMEALAKRDSLISWDCMSL